MDTRSVAVLRWNEGIRTVHFWNYLVREVSLRRVAENLGGAGGIRTHEWRFCRACVLRWPVSFQQVRSVLAGLLWDIWACLGGIVQRIVQIRLYLDVPKLFCVP